MIPAHLRPDTVTRDELMGLASWARAYREEYESVGPRSLELSIGGRLAEKLKFSADSESARDAIRTLHREDIEAAVLATLFAFRQRADSPDDYDAWQAAG